MTNVARTSIAEPAEQATVGRNTSSIAEPAEQATAGRNASCITCGDVAIPMRVVRIGDDGLADCVTDEGAASTVDVSLVDAAPGDQVLVHACVAIQRLGVSPADGVGARG